MELMEDLVYTDDGLEEIGCLEATEINIINEDHEVTVDDVKPKYKSIFLRLKELSDRSMAPKKHATRFVYAVILDIERDCDKRLDIRDFFTVYCEKGSKYWLNPMDQLKKLDDILGRFGGKRSYLFPFLSLLKQTALSGLSPESFLRYVIMPRMEFDYNYREWEKNHYDVLNSIFVILQQLKYSITFEAPVLGTEKIVLARDVVLVKYIGRPLANLPIKQFKDQSLINRYIDGCKKLVFSSSLSVYFIKNNTIPFLRVMSEKIELFQIVEIIEKTAEISILMRIVEEDQYYKIISNHNFNLYGADIIKSLHNRRNKGFKTSDLIKEFLCYLKLIDALISKKIGVYLCRGFVQSFIRTDNFDAKNDLIQLFSVLKECNSIHFYMWHKKKMLIKGTSSKFFFDEIELNSGIHHDYPRIDEIFTNKSDAFEYTEVNDLIASLHIPLETIKNISKNRHNNFSYKDFLKAYMYHYPEHEATIRKFQEDCITGVDRSWSFDDIQQFDRSGRKIHSVLMKSVIRGIGRGFGIGAAKTSSLELLYQKYGEANEMPFIRISSDFAIPRSNYFKENSMIEDEIRKQVNLAEIGILFDNLVKESNYTINNIPMLIRNEIVRFGDPIEKIQGTIIATGELLADIHNTADYHKMVELINIKEKAERQVAVLNGKKNDLNNLLFKYNELSDIQKIVATLYYSSSENNRVDQLQDFVIALLISRYANDSGLLSRINFLRDDIIVDIITFKQFNYILNTIEYLIQTVLEDKEIRALFNEPHNNTNEFIELIRPFLITRTKKVSTDSLEASLKKITSYNKLSKVKSSWQKIYDSINTKETRYYSNYSMFTSKCFIDAYYGDMGGICLSSYSSLVKNPAFHNIRLIDKDEKQIIGMGILYISRQGIKSQGITDYISFFAINPLHSVLSNLSREKQLLIYLQFRKIAEKFALKLKIPVLLSGISTHGIVSNNQNFADLIISYEKVIMKSKTVHDAKGVSIFYEEKCYQYGLLIINPN